MKMAIMDGSSNMRGSATLAMITLMVVIIGVFLVDGLANRNMETRAAVRQARALAAAKKVVIAYGKRVGRLPCPAPDRTGNAGPCQGGVTGQLPWRTLIMHPPATAITYHWLSADQVWVKSANAPLLLINREAT